MPPGALPPAEPPKRGRGHPASRSLILSHPLPPVFK